jgi:hypothetical protein
MLEVRLGRTKFADAVNLDDLGPTFRVKATFGAHAYSYSEFHYFGNPGYYQTFVLTSSNAAPPFGPYPPMAELVEEIGEEWPDRDDPSPAAYKDLKVLPRLREETAVTTYTVINLRLWEENYPSGFGPHGDEVRTLP